MLVPLLIGLPEPIIRVSGFLWTSWTSRGELEVSSGGYIYTMEVNQWTLLIRVSPHSRPVVKQVRAHHLDCPYFHTDPNQAISLSSFTPGITRSSPLCPPPLLKVDSLSGFRLNPFPQLTKAQKPSLASPPSSTFQGYERVTSWSSDPNQLFLSQSFDFLGYKSPQILYCPPPQHLHQLVPGSPFWAFTSRRRSLCVLNCSRGRNACYLHFTEEETEARGIK